MAKERLFELVRKEDVVLFVGAGFSLYAGYPSGGQLAENIYNKLSKSEQKEIEFTKNLSRLAEDIYHLKNGNNNFLLRCIKDTFSKKPTATTTHERMVKIPQIKTIITTNYDSLFEDHNESLEVIRESKDIPLTAPHKPKLYKIHGDLTKLDSIILKTSDYENYFVKNKGQTVFWNQVRAELAKNHILFIGYSLEDSNIITILKRIFNELGDLKKEAFFVTPDLRKSKQNFLRNHGIEYIDSTGEEIIEELTKDLRFNYLPSIQSQGGSADTAIAFGEKYNFKFDLGKVVGKPNLVLNKWELIDKSVPNCTQIKLTSKPDRKLNQKFKHFLESKTPSLKLKKDQLKELSLFQNELRVMGIEAADSIEIIRLPIFEENINLVFDDGYETNEFSLKIISYRPEENKRILEFKMFGFAVKVTINILDNQDLLFNVNYTAGTEIPNVMKAIQFYEVAVRVLDRVNFRVFGVDKEIKPLLSLGDIVFKDEKIIKTNKQMLKYFENLKKIERYFGIKFSNISSEDINSEKVRNVIAYIDDKEILENFGELKMEIKEERILRAIFQKAEDDRLAIRFSGPEKESITLHNQKINIGYKIITIKDGVIQNMKELKEGKGKTIRLRSKFNKKHIIFSDNGLN